jgi:hypothetical protein
VNIYQVPVLSENGQIFRCKHRAERCQALGHQENIVVCDCDAESRPSSFFSLHATVRATSASPKNLSHLTLKGYITLPGCKRVVGIKDKNKLL